MGEETRSIDELADEITTLSAHLNAATCRFLLLIGEFDERGGWGEYQCKSCAHWVAWTCAMSEPAAREHVRVARRLRELPHIRAAFAAGELSYSKVRALTRVENIEREADLLELARSSTAAQLDRIVRAYRGVALTAAQRAYEARYLDVSYDDDGTVVLRGRLPAEEGALVIKAIELARERHATATAGVGPGAPAEAATGGPGRLGAPAEAGDAHDPPVPVEHAVEAPTFGARRADALVAIAEQALEHEAAGTRTGGDRFQVTVHLDVDALRGGDSGRARVEDAAPLALETARRLCCDAALVGIVEREGETLSVGRKTRSIPPALRRALRSRDGGCRFPGCTHRRWLDAHHIQHWADGGETSLDNLVELCRHHHRLLHEGGFSVGRRRGGELVFRRADGRRLSAVPRSPRGDLRRLLHEHASRGLMMTCDTGKPRWQGDRLDLGMAVDAVLAMAPVPDAGAPGPAEIPEPALVP